MGGFVKKKLARVNEYELSLRDNGTHCLVNKNKPFTQSDVKPNINKYIYQQPTVKITVEDKLPPATDHPDPTSEIQQRLKDGYTPIFIFGNDHTINNVDFEYIKSLNVITAGVNRIWLKYHPDYLFFLDNEIIHELLQTKLIFPKTKILTTGYSMGNRQSYPFNVDKILNKFSSWYHTNNNYVKELGLDGSIPNLIQILSEKVYPGENLMFFIFGTSLIWNENKSHFWKNETRTLNNLPADYYKPRFKKQLRSIMKVNKNNIYSTQEESLLNSYFPYIDLNRLGNLIVNK